MTARATAKSFAHATLVAIYQNQALPLRQRIKAAAAAIGYEKPRLAAVMHTAKAGANLTTDELLREIEVVPVMGCYPGAREVPAKSEAGSTRTT